MGDFNITLNCNIDKNTSDFVDRSYSYAFYSKVNSTTEITDNSKL